MRMTLVTGALIALLALVPASGQHNGTDIIQERLRHTRLDEALLAAARKGDVAAVKRFLAQGADPNAVDASCHTALAVGSPNYEVVQVLLHAGADPNLNYMRLSALDVALFWPKDSRTTKLLQELYRTKPRHVFPLWLGKVRKGIGCLGATKDEIVAWFGTPWLVHDIPSSFGTLTRGYVYDSGPWSRRTVVGDGIDNYVAFQFDGESRCSAVLCTFSATASMPGLRDNRERAATVWEYLHPVESGPRITERYVAMAVNRDMPFAFSGTLPGGYPVLLYAEGTVAPVIERKTFSTKTDRFEVVGTVPNPAFHWQDCRVSKIIIAKPGTTLPVPRLENPLKRFGG